MPFVDWRRKKKDISFRVVSVKVKFGRTLVNFIQLKKKKESNNNHEHDIAPRLNC